MNNQVALEKVKRHHVTIECCPTSNLQIKAVTDMKNHPMDSFYKKGVLTTVNTDNRTVSQTTMNDEYKLLSYTFAWGKEEFISIYSMSIDACYGDEKVKKLLRSFHMECTEVGMDYTYDGKITATELKQNLGKYLDFVTDNHELIITKNGQPAFRLSPYVNKIVNYMKMKEEVPK